MIAIEWGLENRDSRVLYNVKLLLVLEFGKYDGWWKVDLMPGCVCVLS